MAVQFVPVMAVSTREHSANSRQTVGSTITARVSADFVVICGREDGGVGGTAMGMGRLLVLAMMKMDGASGVKKVEYT